ncbi:MAG: glycosyltransferase family 2 protein [bacterium]|nr:glycosyltransferase family 2 protein [bacterium]
MDISIIILNYKSKDLVLNCLKSIKEADFGLLKYEIIVVDNNSQDGLKEILELQNLQIIFIESAKNVGMGAGNNLGIRKAQGEYIVIMNPDITVFKETFKNIYDFMEVNSDVGLVGPKQFYPDQIVQTSCFRWYNLFTPIYRRLPLSKFNFVKKDLDRFLMKDYNKEDIKEVNWLLGSFLFCRAKALAEVGLFDEQFFMYFEDTDLCRRFWNKNWKVLYFPKAMVIHNHIRQSARVAWYKFFTSKITIYHIISWLKYLIKWGIK